jgi:hypothetical protein
MHCLHDLHNIFLTMFLLLIIQLQVLSSDPLEAGLAGSEPVDLGGGSVVALETAVEGAALDELRPEVHGHLVAAEGLELVLTLVRVPQLLTQTLP